ncbi:cell division protein FtsQ/DivIB [Roseovarius atlanticus]|uniref:cell division protein FtsQ/DivIB n=1 Tax=Roseovarius atlanticus TaxID=1641875 RepID=UPI001C9392A1|nr:cell division protein FtsQ/DivIB [Roseovarius atlanticus]MBY5989248.1 cell division protein FtsQ/DivIB [Roseovarius atlanticus]MBY6124640.1 cell division protein FtsQ/DivIB [Roseovarius atlanticus]MBY6149135.1 cell division protein FtsQ/DivIB [Roseovarius atlanticus]
MQQVKRLEPRADPAPSRWSYRYQRLMLTPLFRKLLRVGVPLCLTVGLATAYFSNPERREAIVLAVADLREQVETRPEFMVNLLAVEGASPTVEEDIREIFPHDLPASSFDIDLDAVRLSIAGLPAVASASVRVRQGGVLVAQVEERQPVAVWRSRDGLGVVDMEGVVIGDIAHRADRADLPVIAGKGATRAVPEAMAILQAAAPLRSRLRGLVRMGERRWDVVLDRGQRILLPETDPVRALERVIVLAEVQDMLERDLAAVDMRLASRPTIRMNENAVSEWWRVTNMTVGAE